MAQTINIGFKAEMTSARLNANTGVVLGSNGVLKGFNITAGSGKTLNITRGNDATGILIIKGATIIEDADISNSIIIPDNTTGSVRVDTIYARYVVGPGASCIYGILTGTQVVPDDTYCKLAEIVVPNGFADAASCTINNVVKIMQMVKMQIEATAQLTREAIHSGFTKLSDIDYTYASINPNQIKLSSDSVAFMNGYKITIPANTIIALPASPLDVPREDLVFLEVWLDQATGLPNYRPRSVAGVDFTKYSEGLGFYTVNSNTVVIQAMAQGGLDIPYTPNVSITNNVYTAEYVPAMNYGAFYSMADRVSSANLGKKIALNDTGVYVAGLGDQTSKDTLKTMDGYVYAIPMFKIHRRPSCGFMQPGEYDKVSPLTTNPIHVQRIVDGAQIAHSGDPNSMKVTIEGKTLINLLGDAGNCENTSKLGVSTANATNSVDSTLKLFGNSSIKIAASNGGTNYYSDVRGLNSSHKYLYSAYIYISSQTSGTPQLSYCDYNTWSNTKGITSFDITKLNAWQRKSTLVNNVSSARFIFGIASPSTATMNFDGVCLYDLTSIYGAGNEPADIQTLEKQLPFVNGAQHPKSIAIKARGKNLFDKSLAKINSVIYDTGAIGVDANYALSDYTKIRSGISYSKSTANGYVFFDMYKQYILGGSGSSFTPPDNAAYVRYNVPIANLDTFQLEEGSTATTYADYKSSEIIMPSGLITQMKEINGVKDTIDLSKMKATKKISDWITIDGGLNIECDMNFQGFKRFVITGGVRTYGALQNSAAVVGVRYDGAILSSAVYSNENIENQIGTNGTDIYITVSNADTGFTDSALPMNTYLKPYFYGWKACMADGSPWDGQLPVYWKKITDGTGITSTLPTSSYDGYTPYKILCQLATPIDYDLTDLFRGRLYVNPELTTFEINQVSTTKSVPKAITDLFNGYGNFEVDSNSDGVADGWGKANATATIDNTVYLPGSNNKSQKLVPTSGLSSGSDTGLYMDLTITNAHKVYVAYWLKVSDYTKFSNAIVAQCKTDYSSLTNAVISQLNAGYTSFTKVSGLLTWDTVKNRVVIGVSANGTNTTEYLNIDSAFAIDLTAMFGSGNEPDQAWCDKYLSFGTNYAVFAPTGTTALGVYRNNKDVFQGAKNNYVGIPANKYKDGLHEIFYKEGTETHYSPKTTIAIGMQTITMDNAVTISSTNFASTDIPYKKHSDGSCLLKSISGISPYAQITGGYATVNSTNLNGFSNLQIGERYYLPNALNYYEVIYKDSSSATLKYVGNTGTFDPGFSSSMSNSVFYNRDIITKFNADIIVDRDVLDLRHIVSLTGFNYQSMLEENFDKLMRGELQTKDRKRLLKTYSGLPKTPIDDNTVFYASLDGTTTAEVGGSMLINNAGYRKSATGLGIYTDGTAQPVNPVANISPTAGAIDLVLDMDTFSYVSSTSKSGCVISLNNATNNRAMSLFIDDAKEVVFVVYFTAGGYTEGTDCCTTITPKMTGYSGYMHIRTTWGNGTVNIYINGKLVATNTYTKTILQPTSMQIGSAPMYNSNTVNTTTYAAKIVVSDVSISSIDRGNYFPTLPKDFVAGYADIKPAFYAQRKTYSDALTSQYVMEPVRTYAQVRAKHHTVTQATAGTWTANDTIKIKGLAGEIISGVIDSDTALARVVQASSTTSNSTITVYLDDVSKLAVNDTLSHASSNGNLDTIIPMYTVNSIDTTNKTVLLNFAGVPGGSVDFYIGDMLVETTSSSSAPVVKFNNAGTLTIVTGTWSGLGTSEVTFTLGTNAGLTNQDLQFEYSLNMVSGQGGIKEVLSTTFSGEALTKRYDPKIYTITGDYVGKIAGSTVENPHTIKHNHAGSQTALIAPSSFPSEFSQNGYNGAMYLDSIIGSASAQVSANGAIPQTLFVVNMVAFVEQKYGSIPGATTTDKITWLKNNLDKITAYWWGYGACPAGNKAYLTRYKTDTSAWDTTYAISTTSGVPVNLTFNLGSNTITSNVIDSNGYMYFIVYTDATDGVTASTVYTDYIKFDLTLKSSARFDLPQVPYSKGVRKLTMANTIMVRDDFSGKVSGSNTENPNIGRYGNTTALNAPTSYSEDSYIYQYINILDNSCKSQATSTSGQMAQQLFGFNVIEILERKFGKLPCAQDLPSKIAWAKANISKLTANWWGYAISTNNKAYLSRWMTTNNTWSGSPSINASGNIALASLTPGSTSDLIDSTGFAYFIAYTDASNGTTASTIYTDYVNIEITLTTPAGYDVLVPENPRRDDGETTILLVRKETREIQDYFFGSSEDLLAVYGEYKPCSLVSGMEFLANIKLPGDVLGKVSILTTYGTGKYVDMTNYNNSFYTAAEYRNFRNVLYNLFGVNSGYNLSNYAMEPLESFNKLYANSPSVASIQSFIQWLPLSYGARDNMFRALLGNSTSISANNFIEINAVIYKINGFLKLGFLVDNFINKQFVSESYFTTDVGNRPLVK
jgi:hypothetical protein